MRERERERERERAAAAAAAAGLTTKEDASEGNKCMKRGKQRAHGNEHSSLMLHDVHFAASFTGEAHHH